MFTVVILGSDPDRTRYLKTVALATGQMELLGASDAYFEDTTTLRLLQTVQPEVWILDLDNANEALRAATRIRMHFPDAPIVGIGNPQPLLSTGRSIPVSVSLPFPPSTRALVECVDRTLHGAFGGQLKNVIAFIPAKAGVGASTIALNTATALASGCGKKPLLFDADLRSGIVSAMFNLSPEHSTQEVLVGSRDLDNFRWENSIAKVCGIDLLASCRKSAEPMPHWPEYFRVLNFVSPRYDFVIVDLPEVINPATVEIVRRAEAVYVVSTPEVLPLKLARQRLDELAECEVEPERVRVILNRWHKNELAPKDVEEFLDRPVQHVFPNDYPTVRAALIAGTPVAATKTLGRAFRLFAAEITGEPLPKDSITDKLKGMLRT